MKLKLDELLRKGNVSESPYASPIVLVKKKNGDMRMCVDYRALNKITLKDNYPLPVIEDCLDYLGNKKIFSTLDLENSFLHPAGYTQPQPADPGYDPAV